MQIEVEILRTVTITRDESATVEIEVPDSVPEEDRESWILDRLIDGDLVIADSEFELSDETEWPEYQEVNEV